MVVDVLYTRHLLREDSTNVETILAYYVTDEHVNYSVIPSCQCPPGKRSRKVKHVMGKHNEEM